MKKSKKITYKEYSDLVPAMAAYRRNLMQACNITTSNYDTIYTEKRAAGARSKFWLSRFSKKQVDKIVSHIQDHPHVHLSDTKDGKLRLYAVKLVEVVYKGRWRTITNSDYQLVFTAE